MPFDAVFLTAVAQELRQGAQGAKVDKVYQPARDQVILQLRARDANRKLLLSASSNTPRAQFTEEPFENPAQPPMFCMLLRKHLVGGRIAEIRQPPMERLLDFVLDCTDEMGEPVQKRLIIEIMGRNSNLILCGGDGRIIDCLRRVDFEMSEKRQVLPGLFYQYPPTQEKRNPAETDRDTILALLRREAGAIQLDKWLQSHFAALPPVICRELSCGYCGNTECRPMETEYEALADYLAQQFAKLNGPYTPTLLRREGSPKDYSYRPLEQYGALGENETLPTFSVLLDRFYASRERGEQVRQKSQAIHKTLTNLRDRTARKLEIQRKELAATYDRERLRQLGDIVTANLHAITRGQPRLTAVDFYDPDMKEIDIPLSPTLSPQQNAAKFYKDYTKAKNAEKMLTGLIEKGEQEHAYFCSVLDALSRAEGEKDIADIRAELTDGGYLKRSGGKKQMKQQPSKPMVFQSDEGYTIYVGRNNRQNDQLTLKTAEKYDLWLHTQKIHGSHVIIDCTGKEKPGDVTVTQAAQLAAYYSQAREGHNVPVDVTAVRNVKKPAGGKPGMVIYDHYNTVYVTPDAALADRLRVK